MKYFRIFFRLGLRQLFTKRNIALILLILFLSLYSTQKGINEYKQIKDEVEDFNKIESYFFENILNYNNYSYLGFKTLFIPDITSIFFKNPLFLTELSGRVNSVFTLNIIINYKGNLFKGNFFSQFRFSNLLFFIGSLISLFLGYTGLRDKNFLKTLSSKKGIAKCYMAQFIKLLMLSLILLIIIGICLSLTLAQGIKLNSSNINALFITLAPMFFMLLFCFIIGLILRTLKLRFLGIPLLLSLWIILIFLFPASINSILEDSSYKISSSCKDDFKKIKILREFEDKSAKKFGDFKSNTPEVRIKVIEGYLKEGFPKVEAVDENSKKETAQLIEKYNNISLLLPTTFYKLTCEEASSRGYQAYLDFYSYLQDLRRRFVLFWFDQVYYKESEEVVNFVQHDENLFYSKSHIPPGYGLGILISLGEILLLYIISFLLFKRSLAHITSREMAEMGEVRLQLDAGEHRVWAEKDHRFGSTLYHAFHGHIKLLKKLGFQGEIVVDDIDITQEKNSHPFIYICHYRDLPFDLKVKDLLYLYAAINKIDKESSAAVMKSKELTPLLDKNVAELDDIDKFEVVMGFLRMGGNYIYLLDNISSGVPIHCAVKLRQQMVEMAKHAIVILLISPKEINQEQLPDGDYYTEGTAWEYGVKSHEHSLLMRARIEKEEKEL